MQVLQALCPSDSLFPLIVLHPLPLGFLALLSSSIKMLFASQSYGFLVYLKACNLKQLNTYAVQIHLDFDFCFLQGNLAYAKIIF